MKIQESSKVPATRSRGRLLFAVLAGIAAWMLALQLGNAVLRATVFGYAEAEQSLAFAVPMLVARLLLSAVATLLAGMVVDRIARSDGRAALWFGFILTIAFVPIHARLWDKFPLWYHCAFLCSLVPLAALGARLSRKLKMVPT